MAEEGALKDAPHPVKLRNGKELQFGENALLVISKGLAKKRIDRYEWADIERVLVEWFCFSGSLVIKLKNGEQYEFSIRKSQVMHTVSAIHRRIGKTREGRTDTVRKPVDAESLKLLEDHVDVGISDTGLMLRRNTGCWTAGIVFVPWDSLTSIKLSRRCYTGTVTLDTVLKRKPPESSHRHWNARGGTRREGESLLSDSDKDDIELDDDRENEVIIIRGRAMHTEHIYDSLSRRMCAKFADMEERKDAHVIHSNCVSGKITDAGIFATISARFSENKVFIPWSSIISVVYKFPTCMRSSSLVIEDRSGTPTELNGVDEEVFQDLSRIFSDMTLEDTSLKHGREAQQPESEQKSTNLTVSLDGVHDNRAHCCCRRSKLFVPWSKIDGLVFKTTKIGGRVFIVTETGQEVRMADTTTFKAWAEYDRLHTMKYGPPQLHDPVITFNEAKEPHKSCKLSSQSIKVTLNKGKVVKEIDLERVIGARRGRNSHKELEIGAGIGHRSKCMLISVPLTTTQNARELAKEISTYAEKRKQKLQEEREKGALIDT